MKKITKYNLLGAGFMMELLLFFGLFTVNCYREKIILALFYLFFGFISEVFLLKMDHEYYKLYFKDYYKVKDETKN